MEEKRKALTKSRACGCAQDIENIIELLHTAAATLRKMADTGSVSKKEMWNLRCILADARKKLDFEENALSEINRELFTASEAEIAQELAEIAARLKASREGKQP